jgi:N-acyl-D-amino-acid deacylase
MPLLALNACLACDPLRAREFVDVDVESFQKNIVEFTLSTFRPMKEDLESGKEVDGKSLMVGYGLWTLSLAQEPRNELIDALVRNLTLTQRDDGHWDYHSFRPPAASSELMTTALALSGLKRYGQGHLDPESLLAMRNKARHWLESIEPDSNNENVVGRIWCEHLLNEGDNSKAEKGMSAIWSLQRPDGGWAQAPGMESDAYATGQSMMMLSEIQPQANRLDLYNDPNYVRGIRYLIEHQEPEGSWHVVTRAKPVQIYFDNGDPHGKDQFISIMATGWATTVLAEYLAREHTPLSP